MHYLDRAIVIVLKTKRTYFVTPSVNSTSFLQFGQNMLSKSELLSLSAIKGDKIALRANPYSFGFGQRN